MSNPVLVEVLRGGIVESRHRGAVYVCGARRQGCAGNRRHGAAGVSALGGQGDPGAAAGRDGRGRRLWLRQPGTGAGLRLPYRRGDAYRAGGLDAGARRARRDGAGMRQRTGRSTTMPLSRWRARAGADALCNNCSGKHSGFLCTCVHEGIDHQGYVAAGHPFQEMVRETMQEVTGAVHDADNRGDRRLLDPDLRGAADEPGAGLCPHGDRGGACARTRQGGKATARRLHGRAAARRRHRQGRHGADASRARPDIRQDRRRRRLLRGGSGTRSRHRAEMRRWRRTRLPRAWSQRCWQSCSPPTRTSRHA